MGKPKIIYPKKGCKHIFVTASTDRGKKVKICRLCGYTKRGFIFKFKI